eukprot:33348-Pelagomonas_calceolata.AAC.1
MEPELMELDLTGKGSSHGSKCRATWQPLTDTFMPSLKQSMTFTRILLSLSLQLRSYAGIFKHNLPAHSPEQSGQT